MKYATGLAMAAALASGATVSNRAVELQANHSLSPQPVLDWSLEAQRAIVPPGPGGIFGAENYGNKFPGEAAVYMGIVHAAIYDAAVAIEGGYEPYAVTIQAPRGTSAAAAIATAVHHTLVGSPALGLNGLQPALGLTPIQQAILDGDYDAYMSTIPESTAKANGISVGEQVAIAMTMGRQDDGRNANPTLADLNPPPAGPGVWEPNPGNPLPPVLGLRLPRITPLALGSASQFRPDGPNPLTSAEYAEDFDQVKEVGRLDSATRTPEQTTQALFWTDHDLRQWNDSMRRLATARGLDLVQAARMLAMAHVSGGDAMIACFDAKYAYWFWRPYQAIPRADTDGNPATTADATWRPLQSTPNFPEYPSAHACHSGAVAAALRAFFGSDKVSFEIDSRVTHTLRQYGGFHEVVKDVNQARVLAGFHFRSSDQAGANLGRTVGRFVTGNFFQPIDEGPHVDWQTGGRRPLAHRFGAFTLDPDTRQLLLNGGEVHLSPKALDLLALLVEHRVRAVSKAELQQRLWPSTFVEETNLASLVAEIRRALGDAAASPRFVRTVYGFGYQFVGDIITTRSPTRVDASRRTLWLTDDRRQMPLLEGVNVIGRGTDAAIHLDSPGVSRHHARIMVAGGEATLEDLGSKNGTDLNGQRITTPCPVRDGDEIRLGAIVLTFRISSPSSATVTGDA